MTDLSQVNLITLNISSSYFTTTAATVSATKTTAPTAASLNTSRWQLDDSIEGPVIATLVGIEFVLSLPSNLFILIHSLLHYRQSLNKSSTIFLFNLSLSNLLVSLFYMLLYIISSGAEEWIFGSTDYVRNILCQLHGFTFAFTTTVPLCTLAVISFDRFLNIVKPHLHKRILTWKAAFGVVVFLWLIAILIGLVPFFGIGVGTYDWSRLLGGCFPRWLENREYLILLTIFASILFTIISITSSWTFVFTHGFLRRNIRRLTQTLDPENLEIQKHIYSERVRNLNGIFGMLLLFNMLTLLPFVIVSIMGLIIGLDKIPPQIYVTVFVLFLFNNVTNPIIQAYFRKDLYDTIKKYFTRVTSIFKRREVEKKEDVDRRKTTKNSSLDYSAVIERGRNVEEGVSEDVAVVETGEEGRRVIESPCNGIHVHPSCQLTPSVILKSTVTEEENTTLSLSVDGKCSRGGGDGM